MSVSQEPETTGSEQDSPCYSIEQVATRIGMTKRTLRYYEEMGLLPPTDRTEGNYRRYSEADVQRLIRVKELRSLLGFSLSEIRELLSADEERDQLKAAYHAESDPPTRIAQLDRVDELIGKQLELVEQKIAGLEQMRASLQAKLARHAQVKQQLHQI
ncbi:MerR family transcriptional regulator [Ktedonobacter robiniae]|uniref:MerR family transcriptional regulator n=1 Tax=Ktedonobacter robiniae TaxID=2778365 RepID=A0ABQ3UHL3_9CHLR|nr:MerR family transcriptional regulator [Ktedonobacter robiniae]GHO52206.1 MerR family transcriptional regulator [Ktedonobacter robiniae]